ncbi:hypothetical protein SAMN06298212_12028 [Ruaniaceae bacterium KH17]|nr:hypothetical protein SAMN06298212_12028 [Ruaniaceae bacterium KH17]
MSAAEPIVRQLPAGAVEVGEGSVFERAREEMLHLARVYPLDRLLAVFRANAGIDTRGARPPGTWEDFGHPDEEPWSEADYPGRENAPTASLLRGHYAGHFLSMLARAAVTTGEPELHAKVAEFVVGLAEVQRKLAASGRYSHPGFLAAYGEWQFSRLESFAPYGEIWAPYYTCHKIMSGLIDAHELTGNALALDVATAMGYWVHSRLAPLTREHRARMWDLYIAGEFGGMNESLARLAALANEPLFDETASFFEQDVLLDAGTEGRDILTDMHANQHLPQLLGYLAQYERGGEERYLRAVVGLWEMIVPGRMYAHGGTGESELWGPPGAVAGDIGHRNAETCASHNLSKIARRLFAHTLDPQYLEYVERAQLNHILGSRRAVRSDVSPEVTYMFPVHPGALREYDNVGTCCGGTGLENHVSYGEGLAFEGEDALWLAQLYAARISATRMTLEVRSDYPLGGEVSIKVVEADGALQTLHVRIPGWVAAPVSVTVNGEAVAEAEPGEFVDLTRAWAAGDSVEFVLPIELRVEACPDDFGLVALFRGPSLLLAKDERRTQLSVDVDSLLSDAELLPGGGVVAAGIEFEPCWSGSDARYHMYLRSQEASVSEDGIEVDCLPAPSGWFTQAPTLWFGGDSWRLNGGEWSTGPVTLPDGVHEVEVRAVGSNEVRARRTFSVDTTPPVSRARVRELGASVEITLFAEDAVSGVERIQWEGPGTFWGTFQEAFVRALTDEEQVIEFAATDRAGNGEPRQRITLPARPTAR